MLSFCAMAVLAAESGTTAIPFAGYIGYGSQSVKESGYFAGAYVSTRLAEGDLAFQYSYTDISYRDGSDDLAQNDVTIAYGKKYGENLYIKGGVHYIDTDDLYTDGGFTLFGGVEYIEHMPYTFGADLYYTNYSSFDPPLNVWQISPYAGGRLLENSYGSFYFSTRYNFIAFKSAKIEETIVGMSSKMGGGSTRTPFSIVRYSEYTDTYHSVEIKLINYYKAFKTVAAVWVGKEAFAVKDDGFTVFNLAEIHKGGLSLYTSYGYSKSVTIDVGLSYDRFTDTKNGEDSGMTVFTASLGYSF
ncbi:MAG: hypothetical protein L3J42_00725 [Hydrogenimonas sp.]|nr:hypothetical protein [Hydrogenimonas sp.]